jgi:hypothetical protein
MRPSSAATATDRVSSKQIALPRKLASRLLETFNTSPSGATLPKAIWISAKSLNGFPAGDTSD